MVPCVLALDQHLKTFQANYLRTVKDAFADALEERFDGIFQRIAGTLHNAPQAHKVKPKLLLL